MILCPNCRNTEPPGALFCSRCGSPIQDAAPDVRRVSNQREPFHNLDLPKSDELPKSSLSIMLLDFGEILTLTGKTEYSVGRSSPEQLTMPDIDLGPYQAYEKGVSRLHVLVKMGGERVFVSDLGSVNGTYLNGKRILANQPFPIKHGDILTLGKMRIQVLVRS